DNTPTGSRIRPATTSGRPINATYSRSPTSPRRARSGLNRIHARRFKPNPTVATTSVITAPGGHTDRDACTPRPDEMIIVPSSTSTVDNWHDDHRLHTSLYRNRLASLPPNSRDRASATSPCAPTAPVGARPGGATTVFGRLLKPATVLTPVLGLGRARG